MAASLYIHIPYCASKCSYCDFFSVPCAPSAVPDEYVAALCAEIRLRSQAAGVADWKSVYFGGGTPSLLNALQIRRIMDCVRSCGSLDTRQAEVTMEVNPDDVDSALLSGMEGAGVNRLSCGVQAIDERLLKECGRRSSVSRVRAALSLIQRDWKGVFSADMISGLPGQTEQSFLAGLSELVSYKPAHISLYSLVVEEKTPLGKKICSGSLPYDFDFADELWICGRDFLLASGYRQYEVSNFCIDGSECVHNMTYWRLENYIGCGAGAAGSTYGNFFGARTTNTSDLTAYIDFWTAADNPDCIRRAPQETELIDRETMIFEFFMMGLRTTQGVCREDFEKRFGAAFPQKIDAAFTAWTARGLAEQYERDGRHYAALNKEGLLFLNRFLAESG
ncbi:MAG: radical SAM family heme chaperone HemW [Treponema sp.]